MPLKRDSTRVLIAEDDALVASFVRMGLEAEHYAVDVTTDGEEARAMAGEMDYDLLMLDLNLPRVDGVNIARHLRTRKPSMPILVLTSRNRVEGRVLCLDLGADDYMAKPFSFAELSARIRALLRRSHLPVCLGAGHRRFEAGADRAASAPASGLNSPPKNSDYSST
jgi:DNA-binding response OmpR family regulator